MANENRRLRLLDPAIKLDHVTRRELNRIFDAIDDEIEGLKTVNTAQAVINADLQTQITDIKDRIDAFGIP
jgi:hypothetical protein